MVKVLSEQHKQAIRNGVNKYYDKVWRQWTINKQWYVDTHLRWDRKYAHRRIMEEYLWRELLPNEIVHHKNWDKSDNKIENLEVMTREEHSKLHIQGRESFLKSRIWISPSNKTNDEIINRIIRLRQEWHLLSYIKRETWISYPTIIKYLHSNLLKNGR